MHVPHDEGTKIGFRELFDAHRPTRHVLTEIVLIAEHTQASATDIPHSSDGQ